MKGFTLIEISLVMAFTTLILIFTVPATLRFIGSQNLSETASALVSSLRQAHNQAVFQKNDSSFGVKFLPTSYIVFQGSSYASRTTSQDITIPLSGDITLSGISEIVFTKRTGLPSTTGTILIQSSSKSLSVSINQQGIIENI
ncbi:MAG: hypothetical protein KBC98_02590 [Candidatus Pacebacteria bacterium]|nr:hypothetical protein [Candidatus Paceibacterota bacterium]